MRGYGHHAGFDRAVCGRTIDLEAETTIRDGRQFLELLGLMKAMPNVRGMI